MRTLLRNLSYVIAGFAAVLLIAVLILFILGYRPFILMTSSMEPLYRQGSLCLVDTTVGLDELNIGDTLVYRSSSNSLVLHRLIASSPSSTPISTSADDQGKLNATLQGDKNQSVQDVELSRINYVGREAFTIPQLGSFFSQFRQYVWLLVGVMIVLACVPPISRSHTTASSQSTSPASPDKRSEDVADDHSGEAAE